MYVFNVCSRICEIVECYIKFRVFGLMRVSLFCSNELLVIGYYGIDVLLVIVLRFLYFRVFG